MPSLRNILLSSITSGLMIAALTILADGSARAQLDRALSAALFAGASVEAGSDANSLFGSAPAEVQGRLGTHDGRRLEASAMSADRPDVR